MLCRFTRVLVDCSVLIGLLVLLQKSIAVFGIEELVVSLLDCSLFTLLIDANSAFFCP